MTPKKIKDLAGQLLDALDEELVLSDGVVPTWPVWVRDLFDPELSDALVCALETLAERVEP